MAEIFHPNPILLSTLGSWFFVVSVPSERFSERLLIFCDNAQKRQLNYVSDSFVSQN